jgi:hypothetical protein
MPVVVKAKKVVTAVDAYGGKILLEYNMSLGGRDFYNQVTIRISTQ